MTKLICEPTDIGDVLACDFTDRPCLHEQGQVVVRGFVRSLTVSDDGWELRLRDAELLRKFESTWEVLQEDEHYAGPLNLSAFKWCRDRESASKDKALNITCYGMVVHIGLNLPDPWRDNCWPDLDTEFLTEDML